MVFIELTDTLRMPLLILEWIFAVISAELGIVFLIKNRRKEEQIKISQELGYALLFFGLSAMWFFFIVGDFYVPSTIASPFFIWTSGSERALSLSLGYFSLLIGATLFTFQIEKNKRYLFRKYFFTSCFTILIFISLIAFFIDLGFSQILSFVLWPILVLFFTIYFINFFKGTEHILMELSKFIPTFFLLSAGTILSSAYLTEAFGLEIRLVGAILQIGALGILFYYFIKLPAFSEFQWKDKIEEIFLMNKGGICLYHRSFSAVSGGYDELLMSGAISSINIMLKEATSAKDSKTSIIKKKGKIVNIYTSDLITGVLISKEELNSINFYLKKLVQKIEYIFSSVLIHWNGDRDVFSLVEGIVNGIFVK